MQNRYKSVTEPIQINEELYQGEVYRSKLSRQSIVFEWIGVLSLICISPI